MIVFIISWAGQHENARAIADALRKVADEVAIVYSDPDPELTFDVPCKLIRRPNELFWEDKFKACLDSTGSDGMLVIHADCSCDDWEFLLKRCVDAKKQNADIGVWAPNIEGTYYELRASRIFNIKGTDLALCAIIDAIIFYISPEIVDRMRQIKYGNNKFGWGIGSLFCANSYAQNKFVVIDQKVKVFHPRSKRGYDSAEARRQKKIFLNQYSISEMIQYQLLSTHVHFKHLKAAIEKNPLESSKPV